MVNHPWAGKIYAGAIGIAQSSQVKELMRDWN